MDYSLGVSRRRILRMAASLAGVVTPGVLGRARAQTAKKIERYAPELDGIISTSESLQELWVGNGIAGNPAEGPVWVATGGYLLFNDMLPSRRMKYSPGVGVTVAMERTGGANGLTLDLQGRLISAERDTRRVTRTEVDGAITVVADQYLGKRLPPPNDVLVKSDGAIYFTTPGGGPEEAPVAVYRVSPDLKSISLVADGMIVPNGLAFSPNEDILYIVDSGPRHVRAYDVLENGLLSINTGRVFADMSGPEPGGPDGMKVDTAGNVYAGGAGGLYILDSKGRKLGRIVHGLSFTTNIAFGGDDWKSLYFTTRSTLNVVNVKIPGIPCPQGRSRCGLDT